MNREFIQRSFQEYYSQTQVKAPPSIEQREFGVGSEKKIDSRHLTFNNIDRLNFYLRSAVPLYISYSAAFYEYPDARPMSNKNWIGADLIFDLDADDCEVECTHPPGDICEECMKQVTTEASRLVNGFLKTDFGFKKEDMIIVFSGNRGFHVHVRHEKVSDLNQDARKEIIDYITAENIKLITPGTDKQLLGPKPETPGWGGRIALALYESIKSSNGPKDFKEKTGIKSSGVTRLFKNKQTTLEALDTGIWSKTGLSANALNDLITDTAGKLRVNLDKGVTMDMARLIRLPGSLHGGTGMKACEIEDITKFDAFTDPLVFDEKPFKVRPKQDKDFKLKNKYFQLEKGQAVELPKYAAMYAVCKDWVNIDD